MIYNSLRKLNNWLEYQMYIHGTGIVVIIMTFTVCAALIIKG